MGFEYSLSKASVSCSKLNKEHGLFLNQEKRAIPSVKLLCTHLHMTIV